MVSKVLIFVAIFGGSLAFPQAPPAEGGYQFEYEVKDEESGVDFGQQEAREGNVTEGSYNVQLPDTRLMTVTYKVDGDSGYVVEVTYEGEAVFPEEDPAQGSVFGINAINRIQSLEADPQFQFISPASSSDPGTVNIVENSQQSSFPGTTNDFASSSNTGTSSDFSRTSSDFSRTSSDFSRNTLQQPATSSNTGTSNDFSRTSSDFSRNTQQQSFGQQPNQGFFQDQQNTFDRVPFQTSSLLAQRRQFSPQIIQQPIRFLGTPTQN